MDGSKIVHAELYIFQTNLSNF